MNVHNQAIDINKWFHHAFFLVGRNDKKAFFGAAAGGVMEVKIDAVNGAYIFLENGRKLYAAINALEEYKREAHYPWAKIVQPENPEDEEPKSFAWVAEWLCQDVRRKVHNTEWEFGDRLGYNKQLETFIIFDSGNKPIMNRNLTLDDVAYGKWVPVLE
jgi:hypothetical protein